MQFDLQTFAFEIVNFVALIWLMRRFVYRPVAAAIAERRAAMEAERAAVAAERADAAAASAQLAARQGELEALRDKVFAEATADAAAQRARLIAQARDDAAAERAKVQATLESERAAALGWVRETAIERGAEVAGKLLLELTPDAAHEALVARLLERLGAGDIALAGPPTAGRRVAEATYARPPTASEVAALEGALAACIGAEVQLQVGRDAALGAGLLLRLGDRTYDATLAGQLQLLRDEARRLLATPDAA